jgi:hypothetical protein
VKELIAASDLVAYCGCRHTPRANRSPYPPSSASPTVGATSARKRPSRRRWLYGNGSPAVTGSSTMTCWSPSDSNLQADLTALREPLPDATILSADRCDAAQVRIMDVPIFPCFSCGRCQGLGLGFHGPHEILDGVDFLFLETCLTTLLAHPRRHSIENEVTAAETGPRPAPSCAEIAVDRSTRPVVVAIPAFEGEGAARNEARASDNGRFVTGNCSYYGLSAESPCLLEPASHSPQQS